MRVCTASISTTETDLTKLELNPGLTIDLRDHRDTSPLRALARARPSAARLDDRSAEGSPAPPATLPGALRSTAAVLSYELDSKDLMAINADFECSLLDALRFDVEHRTDASGVCVLDIDERPFLDLVSRRVDLAIGSFNPSLCSSVSELLHGVRAIDPGGATEMHRFLLARFLEPQWKNLVSERVFRVHIWSRLPHFAYASYLPTITSVDLVSLGHANSHGADPVNERLLAEVLQIAGSSLAELDASSALPAFWTDLAVYLSRELTAFVGGTSNLTVALATALDRANHVRLEVTETGSRGAATLQGSDAHQLLSLMLFSRAATGGEDSRAVMLLDGIDRQMSPDGHAALVTALEQIASQRQVVFMPHDTASWRSAYAAS